MVVVIGHVLGGSMEGGGAGGYTYNQKIKVCSHCFVLSKAPWFKLKLKSVDSSCIKNIILRQQTNFSFIISHVVIKLISSRWYISVFSEFLD